jgi:threonine/homoserine/homoserine lactone efflux protein
VSVPSAVASFALVAGLLTIVPGLDTALVLRSVVQHGRRHAFCTALGINSGTLVWGTGAAVGVAALLTASTLAYDSVRIVGAAYMALLGARLIWTGVIRRPAEHEAARGPDVDAQRGGAWHSWRRGVLTNLLNPKIGAFYVAVLPQFIPEHAPHLAMGILLALVHDVEGMLWFTLIILSAARTRRWLRRRAVQRLVDGGTGSVLIGFGLKLGLSAR